MSTRWRACCGTFNIAFNSFYYFEGTTRQRAQISFGNCSLLFSFIAYFKWYISISLILRWRACSGFFNIVSDSWPASALYGNQLNVIIFKKWQPTDIWRAGAL